MAEPTLAFIFGATATQDTTTLTIHKADLTGLTATANNTAESLLAAIIAFAENSLTEANQTNNPDQSIIISDSFGGDSIVSRNNTNYRRKSKTITFDKVDSGANFNPNDY